MSDQLYLSLWYPNFRLASLGPAVVRVLEQFKTRVAAATVYPISWIEPPVYQRIYEPERVPEDVDASLPPAAVGAAFESLHDDYAYEFEMPWPLWVPETGGGLDVTWRHEPQRIRVTGFGPEFEQGTYEQNGHVRVDFGQDTPFLIEEVELDREAAAYVKRNVEQLVSVINAVQQNCGVSSRLLWSESGESLAQKLISRLQHLQ